MNSLIDQIAKIGENMKDEQSSLKEVLTAHVSDAMIEDGVSRLVYNHCLNKTSLREWFDMSKVTFNRRIEQAVLAQVIGEPIYQNKQHLFTRHQIAALFEYFNFPTYQAKYNSIVTTFENHKGGTGKTTSCVTMASAAALDLALNARILLIDLDPQGSAGSNLIYKYEEDDIVVTMADILLSDIENEGECAQLLKDGFTLEHLVLSAPFNTHLPNFQVMPAYPTDDRFTDLFWKLDGEQQEQLLTKLTNQIIPILKEKYDIIFIDTPPQDSPIVWSANIATEFLVVPITPQEFDFASTANYMTTLALRLRDLPYQGKNLKQIKLLAVNVDEKSKPQKNTLDKLIRSWRDKMFTTAIAHSDLFTAAAEQNRTVLDVKKSEVICSDKQFDVAVNSVDAVYKQFINELKIQAA